MDINRIKQQLEILKNPLCSLNWASEKYGIDFRVEEQLTGRFRIWALRFKNRKDGHPSYCPKSSLHFQKECKN